MSIPALKGIFEQVKYVFIVVDKKMVLPIGLAFFYLKVIILCRYTRKQVEIVSRKTTRLINYHELSEEN